MQDGRSFADQSEGRRLKQWLQLGMYGQWLGDHPHSMLTKKRNNPIQSARGCWITERNQHSNFTRRCSNLSPLHVKRYFLAGSSQYGIYCTWIVANHPYLKENAKSLLHPQLQPTPFPLRKVLGNGAPGSRRQESPNCSFNCQKSL